jgi:ABC-type transport system involved in cytochrome bd biosynthesis fused ATPase/permease subunit
LANSWCDISLGYTLSSQHFTELLSLLPFVQLKLGRIVEQGTHNQLLAANGLYARLWARQSGGFLGEE